MAEKKRDKTFLLIDDNHNYLGNGASINLQMVMFPRNPLGGAVHHFSCRSLYLSHYLFYCFIFAHRPRLALPMPSSFRLINCQSFLTV
jgi:hypothetical protein